MKIKRSIVVILLCFFVGLVSAAVYAAQLPDSMAEKDISFGGDVIPETLPFHFTDQAETEGKVDNSVEKDISFGGDVIPETLPFHFTDQAETETSPQQEVEEKEDDMDPIVLSNGSVIIPTKCEEAKTTLQKEARQKMTEMLPVFLALSSPYRPEGVTVSPDGSWRLEYDCGACFIEDFSPPGHIASQPHVPGCEVKLEQDKITNQQEISEMLPVFINLVHNQGQAKINEVIDENLWDWEIVDDTTEIVLNSACSHPNVRVVIISENYKGPSANYCCFETAVSDKYCYDCGVYLGRTTTNITKHHEWVNVQGLQCCRLCGWGMWR